MNVTTIIANYNYGQYVVSAVKSALHEDYKNHNIVVVDDGSTDDSIDRLKKEFGFSSFVKSHVFNFGKYEITCDLYKKDNISVLATKNNGASLARNIGMWYSWNDTDIFSILDADDEYVNNKISSLVPFLKDDVGVVYADYVIERNGYTKYEYKKPYSINQLMKECIVHSGSLIKKKYLELVKLSDGQIYRKELHGPAGKEFIGCTEDYDLWLRLSQVCMFTHIPDYHTYVREHGQNQSFKMTQEIFNNNLQIIQNLCK